MRYLRQSTAVSLPVGPFVDYWSGVTAETGVTIVGMDNAGIIKNGAGSSISVGGSAVSHIAGGHYSFQFTVSHTDTTGLLRLFFQDDSIFAPVWEDFTVLDTEVYDNKYLGTRPKVNVVQISAVSLSGTGGVTTVSEVVVGLISSAVTFPSSATISSHLSMVKSTVTFPSNVNISVTAVSGAVTGNITGSILGGVVGNVAGVTGNVAGNLTGSVGSVAGNLTGSVLGGVVGNVAGVTGNITGNILGSIIGGVGGNVAGVTGNVTIGSIISSATLPSSVTLGAVLSSVSYPSSVTISASIIGNIAGVTGNVGGNITGSILGGIVGNVGSVTGNIFGGVIGNISGSILGGVAGNIAGVTGNVSIGSIISSATLASSVTLGAILSSVSIPSTVTIVASIIGNVAGVTGNIGGNITGSILGSIIGNVAGVTGNVNGSVLGGVIGNVNGVTNNITVGSIISSATLASSVTLGAVLSSTSYPSSVTISANVIGNIAGVTGNIGGSVLGSVIGNVAGVTNNIGGNVIGSILGGVIGNVNGVTNNVSISNIISSVTLPSAVTVGVNQDKTGYSLSGTSTILDNMNDLNIGEIVTALNNISAADVWGYSNKKLTSGVTVEGFVSGVTGNIGGSILGGIVGKVSGITNNVTVGSIISSATLSSAVTVGLNQDKTGYFISGTSTTLDSLNDLNAGEISSGMIVTVSAIQSTVTVPSSVTFTIGSNQDKTGYFISGTSTTLDSLNDLNAGEISSLSDWTAAEKQQIRHALGVSGVTTSAVSGQLQFIQDMLGGRWKIDTTTNEMIFYKSDNLTEVARFTLKDKNATAAWNNVFERTRG